MASTAHKTAAEYVEYLDAPDVLDAKVTQLASWMREARHTIAFTGAGISTACGIPDFRSGMNTVLETGAGAWTLRAEMEKTGGRLQQQAVKRRVPMLQAIPSHAHMALVKLREQNMLKFLVTQNTDGLHRRSGFPTAQLAELHGNTNLEKCAQCNAEYLRDFSTRTSREVREHRTGRTCAKCGGDLRDSIINFGEGLPERELRAAFHAAERADLCLVLGSSLRVTPAASIPEIVGRKPRTAGRLVIVNLQATPLDDLAALRINGKIDDVVCLLMTKLQLDIPMFRLQRRLQISQWLAPASSSSSTAAAANPAKQLAVQVSGVEADGTPMSLFREVRIRGVAAASVTEPHRFAVPLPMRGVESLAVALSFYGHYREPDVALTVSVQIGSVQTWLLEYDPRHAGGHWTRQELVHTASGPDALDQLAAVSSLSVVELQRQTSSRTRATAVTEEAKEQVDLIDMAAKEQREGVTTTAGAIHAAATHPPTRVARMVLRTRGTHQAILTKHVPADSPASGHSWPTPSRGDADTGVMHAFDARPPRAVIITCGGAGGGPGHLGCAGPSSVYEALAVTLPQSHDIAVLQVVYARASHVPSAVADVQAAIEYCLERRWGPLVLMGWSMGAAVIAQAGAPYAKRTAQFATIAESSSSSSSSSASSTAVSTEVPVIRGLIFLAGQSAGVEALASYSDQCAFLMLHGDADDCLPARCADFIHARAPCRADKQVRILKGNHHGVQDAESILREYIPNLLDAQAR